MKVTAGWKPAFLAAAAAVAALTATEAAHAQDTPAQGQRRAEQALADMHRQGDAGVAVCSLITRADVKRITGIDPMVDAEATGSWVCNVGTVELKLYRSWDGWEQTLKTFKFDKEPRMAAAEFGDRAHYLFVEPASRLADPVLFLAAQSGPYVLALSLDMPDGKSPDSAKPALQSLMKTAIARLPK